MQDVVGMGKILIPTISMNSEIIKYDVGCEPQRGV